MPLWLFALVIFGGLLLFGIAYDVLTKRKRSSEEIQTSIKNASPSEQVYKETFLDNTNERIPPH
ncbi:hypothetical protein LOK74_23345 [Brevibacillus humidisoli]|uniref:hypothetical protein n=1 Tax=Brevibacillus humidisoli TaxID=2895522 RepID=UPI001E4A80AA|nr:hypothetical protein [Brevibacillus humidisoli]UFJ40886.1 hypothetical protein LOK74_23345 [Brevibacillus humidisoli]